LHPLIDDEFVVARWGMHRVLQGMESAERFLTQIGGRHG
jgi:hypothetical protein